MSSTLLKPMFEYLDGLVVLVFTVIAMLVYGFVSLLFDKENTFVTTAFFNKKYSQGHKYKDTKNIKDWTIYDFK